MHRDSTGEAIGLNRDTTAALTRKEAGYLADASQVFFVTLK